MRKMKKTGIEWCSEIPDNWSTIRFKDRYVNKKDVAGESSSDYERLALTLDGVIKRPKDDSEGLQPKAFDSYQILRSGDFVFKMIDLQNVSTSRVGLSPYTGLVSPAYIRFSPKEEDQYSRFVYHYLMSMYYNCVFNSLGGDGVRSSLNATDMGTIIIPYPSVEEQKRIADYIDYTIVKIDALIANEEKQIEKLKEYKQSLITEVVTKGLDPDAPMKDSGVEWIGRIPQHWICKKIKYVTSISRGLFNHRPRNDERLYGGQYPFIQTGDVARANKYINNYTQTLNDHGKVISKEFPKGTLTMTIAANVGDVAILNFNAYFPDSVVGFIPRDGYDSNYLYYVFTAMKSEFIRKSIANTQLNLNIERIKDLIMPTASSLEEQREVTAYLDNSCKQIIDLISIKQNKIDKLNQYKKSLIYEYVTGKKEVN